MSIDLTAEELGLLTQLIESGVSLSSERLALLSGAKWEVVSASVEALPIVRALTIFHKDAARNFGANLRSRSLMPLDFLMLFPEWSTQPLEEALAKSAPALKNLPNRTQAVVAEIANILGQGIVKALADRLNLSILLSTPQVSTGTKTELMHAALEKFDGRKDTVVMTHVEMFSGNLSTVCSMILILDAAVMQRLLKKAILK
jgi:chemotaxis protein CheY-P-specific phosphatase CheC